MKFIFLFLSFFYLGRQKITTVTVDHELEKSNALLNDGKTDDMIKLNLSILEESKQINYPKGKVYSCYNLALAYSMQYRYNRSNYYLKLMESEFKNLNDEDEEISMNLLYSMNYKGIKMYDEALNKLRKNLTLAENIKSDSTRYFSRILTIVEMAKNYIDKKDYDSATYYCKRVIEEAKKPKKMDTGLNTSLKITFLILSEAKLKENKIDSSEFYIKSAQSVPIVLGNNEFRTFKLLGQIHEARKEYDSAIVDYKKSIDLATKAKSLKKLLELYYLMYGVYEKVGQADNQKQFLLKYKALNDTLNLMETNNLKDTVALFVKEKQKPLENENKLLFYIIVVAIIGVGFVTYLFNKRIRNKNTLLNSKNQENEELNLKLNLAFEEVIKLAKSNNPEFITRFQEVYPNFFKNLLEIEPQLLNTELKFCALLFLNFSTKDIASYTFVQPQAIQMRKNRLRKKLNIPSDEDIYIWMKNINKA